MQRYIQKNGLVPGDRLMSERDFATELAVSRTSVRQALTVMSYLGLVDIRPGEGVFVGHSEEALDSVSDHGSLLDGIFDKGITLDLLEARRILECGVAPLIIDRVTEDDITELKNLVDKYEKDLEDHGLVTTRDDIEFHTKVVQLCQNDYLINIYIQISRVWLRSSRDS
ncbi:MAG: FadR family transcriptional regulator, partial [Firmicutes bacterium]|nr:FadR family transcriptional regulator [Bacillota bacterium]